MRLLLADDHHVVREAIAAFLRRVAADISVTEAATLDQVLPKLTPDADFDLIVLDYNMPGMNGLAGLDAVRAKRPGTPVAILSGHITMEECRAALDRGAAGIILKELHGTALLTALRQIVRGETYVPGGLREAWSAQPDGVDPALQQRIDLGRLTPRELDCVRLLVRGSTNQQIAEALELAEVTIKLHLHSAYKKMGARNRSDAVRIAMLKGLTAL